MGHDTILHETMEAIKPFPYQSDSANRFCSVFIHYKVINKGIFITF